LILRNKNGLAYYQFEHLAAFPEIQHGIFTRVGGCSQAPFQRLNVSFTVGDDPEHVGRNRALVAVCMEGQDLVFAHQVHGNTVRVIDGVLVPAPVSGAAAVQVGDAMVTDRTAKLLVVQVADCQPVLLFDPEHRVVANIHSGWRGSVANVAGRTLQVMRERFGCSARAVLAGVGPSLGPCCAEFVNYRDEIPRELWGYRRDSVHFDFWDVTRDQLMAAGVPAEHIHISGMCTKCHTDRFFSYRGERRTGRFPAVIGVRESSKREAGSSKLKARS
jgi:YfiH family protein